MLLFVDLHDVYSKRLCGEEAATLNPNPDTIWAWRTLVLCAKVGKQTANWHWILLTSYVCGHAHVLHVFSIAITTGLRIRHLILCIAILYILKRRRPVGLRIEIREMTRYYGTCSCTHKHYM